MSSVNPRRNSTRTSGMSERNSKPSRSKVSQLDSRDQFSQAQKSLCQKLNQQQLLSPFLIGKQNDSNSRPRLKPKPPSTQTTLFISWARSSIPAGDTGFLTCAISIIRGMPTSLGTLQELDIVLRLPFIMAVRSLSDATMGVITDRIRTELESIVTRAKEGCGTAVFPVIRRVLLRRLFPIV